jgi:hypothetical protein
MFMQADQQAALNPYATPKAVVADEGTGSEAEALRKEHITHEASVKSAGVLFMLGGLVTLAAAAAMVVPGVPAAGDRPGFLVIGMAVGILGVSYVAVGWGVRQLRGWAKIPAIVLAAIGLLGFPIGTLINAYILWLLLSRKGRMVLSADYAVIVDATPHIRYRTSVVVWVVLGLLVLLIVLAFAGAAAR